MYKKMWTKRCPLFLRTPQTISIYKTYEGKAERKHVRFTIVAKHYQYD